MKISFDWLKSYISIDEDVVTTGKRLTDTGLEVEGIEKYEPIPGGLEGLVIGEVLTCGQHPNADRLRLTTVDIGGDEPSPIVCGAPNVAEGQKVIVATVGSMLYPEGQEPFKIKKAKIRGEVSMGMICAEDEIGVGTSHDGIMVLDTALPNGAPASEYFELAEDYTIEIGLTPNRADATSHIGVARDLKAVLDRPVHWPDVSEFNAPENNTPIPVEVEDFEGCPRYCAVNLSGVKVGPSPDWLQSRLKSIGLSPINNIVDITNFVLFETGQPLHAFDASEIEGNKVIVTKLANGTKFTTLDEKERTLTSDDLMICDANRNGLCIAGVFGGVNSGVKESTTEVFLECAYFSADTIRKTALHHKLKTDASFRYERGTDPEMPIYAIKRAALLMQEIAGARISSSLIDIYPNQVQPNNVPVSYANIDRLIGIQIPHDRIHGILESLDITLENKTQNGFTAIVPAYRVDVTREADVIEEILRIYGFNNVELPDNLSSDYLAEFDQKSPEKLQRTLTEFMVSNGYFEVLTNSLTRTQFTGDHVVEVLNKLSEDLGVMRQTMLPSLMEVAAYNLNRKQSEIRIFEFGKTYFKKPDGYQENRQLAILLTGQYREENWQGTQRPSQFHDLSGAVLSSLSRILPAGQIRTAPATIDGYDYALEATIGKKSIAQIGKIKSETAKEMGIQNEVFFAVIDWDILIQISNNSVIFKEVPKYPEVRRDLSLVIDKNVTFEEVRSLAFTFESRLLKDLRVFDVYEGEKIAEDKKAYAIAFTLQDENKTLDDKVIDKAMSRLMKGFESELNAIIRK